MSTSTSLMSVPVEKFEITDGPGLKRLELLDGLYEISAGISVNLTLRTLASNRTFVREVTAYYFVKLEGDMCEFSVLIRGLIFLCSYNYTTRTGSGIIDSQDDLKRYFAEQAASM